jgi:hypothetical protein
LVTCNIAEGVIALVNETIGIEIGRIGAFSGKSGNEQPFASEVFVSDGQKKHMHSAAKIIF